jgi:hypothetical protein
MENVRIGLQRATGTSLHFWRSERSLNQLNDKAMRRAFQDGMDTGRFDEFERMSRLQAEVMGINSRSDTNIFTVLQQNNTQVNQIENNDILKSSMVTPEVRQMTHENNILRTGLPLRHDSRPELIGHDSKANMKANGPVPKTAMPIGHMRFAGAKKA